MKRNNENVTPSDRRSGGSPRARISGAGRPLSTAATARQARGTAASPRGRQCSAGPAKNLEPGTIVQDKKTGNTVTSICVLKGFGAGVMSSSVMSDFFDCASNTLASGCDAAAVAFQDATGCGLKSECYSVRIRCHGLLIGSREPLQPAHSVAECARLHRRTTTVTWSSRR
jgi:hypothetical protein